MFDFYVYKFKTLLSLIRIKIRTKLFQCRIYGYPIIIYSTPPKVIQSLYCAGKGKIILGQGVNLGVYPSPGLKYGEMYLEARNSAAEIKIGNRVFINNNAVIIADKSKIEIGDDTLIGPNFTCFDSDFHSLHPEQRMGGNYNCKEVVIGRNVFIGANVTILKGSIIGHNSVIGAGTVISGVIPDNVIVSSTKQYRVSKLRSD